MLKKAGLFALGAAATVALTASCGELFATGCTDVLVSVLQVDVVDSVTNAPAAGGSRVWVLGDGFADSIAVPDTASSEIAHLWSEDRIKAGTYTVKVEKAGYRTWWTGSPIRVRANSCHVTTHDHIVARLQR